MAARGYSRRQVLANAAIAASRVGLVAVGRRSIFVVPERQVSTSRGFLPVPRVPSGCGRHGGGDLLCSRVCFPYGGRCRAGLAEETRLRFLLFLGSIICAGFDAVSPTFAAAPPPAPSLFGETGQA